MTFKKQQVICYSVLLKQLFTKYFFSSYLSKFLEGYIFSKNRLKQCYSCLSTIFRYSTCLWSDHAINFLWVYSFCPFNFPHFTFSILVFFRIFWFDHKFIMIKDWPAFEGYNTKIIMYNSVKKDKISQDSFSNYYISTFFCLK